MKGVLGLDLVGRIFIRLIWRRDKSTPLGGSLSAFHGAAVNEADKNPPYVAPASLG
jgi:hypothetical protein